MGTRRPAGSGEVETTKHVWDEDLTELNNPLPRWWVMLFYADGTLAFGVIYLMVYPGLGSNAMFLGWTQVKEYEEEMARAEARYGPIFERYAALPIEEVAADPSKALRPGIGERLFASYCALVPRILRTRAACRASPTCATTSGSGAASLRSTRSIQDQHPRRMTHRHHAGMAGRPRRGLPGWTRRSPHQGALALRARTVDRGERHPSGRGRRSTMRSASACHGCRRRRTIPPLGPSEASSTTCGSTAARTADVRHSIAR